MKHHQQTRHPWIGHQILALISSVTIALTSPQLHAETTAQMNLSELYQHAGKVFRGTVRQAVPGRIRAGGGELQVITYRIAVDESFKGDFPTAKKVRYADIAVTQGITRHAADGRELPPLRLASVPGLAVGERYLLLVTSPSSIGTSAPVGLGQGAFHITGQPGAERAVNAFGNRMLFARVQPTHASTTAHAQLRGSRDPAAQDNALTLTRYSDIAEKLRSLARQGSTP